MREYYLFTVKEVDRIAIIAKFQTFSIQTLEGDEVRKLLYDKGIKSDEFVSDVVKDVLETLE